MERKRAGKK